ncbi:hypothetical protein JOF53_006410 [Crossiella equi]|uniref:Uncharacterized protein n=2 Tax=Crossiella equi TaxID=130796 RepID=A0ABS5ALV1_9PSEU|nr:hypothetical protein [Crossiella equi]MBP2477538.1 hypothetical protein [Crossiella equi]
MAEHGRQAARSAVEVGLTSEQDSVVEHVVGALAEGGPGLLVNLVGPVGSGKSVVLAAVRRAVGAQALCLDEPASVPESGPVVLASRSAWPDWPGPVRTVALQPWPDQRIRQLAHSVAGSQVDLVVRLSGGVPLVARLLCRASRGSATEVPGALADEVLRGVLGHEPDEALSTLAVVGHADEELLVELAPAGADWFAAASRSHLVRPTVHGLAVREPFRTLLDLRQAWRRPVARRNALAAAVARNRLLSELAADEPVRQALRGHALFLGDDPVVREALFPAVPPLPVVPARPQDGAEIGRLVRQVHRGGAAGGHGVDELGADLLRGWLANGLEGLHLVWDGGRVVGLHAALPPSRPFTGVVVCEDGHRAARAALLRHLHAVDLPLERVAVDVPWPELRVLAERLGGVRPGPGAEAAPGELPDELRWCLAQVRDALEHLDEPQRLAGNPLLASPVLPDSGALRSWLCAAVDELAGTADPQLSQAGLILDQYYRRRRRNHVGIAQQLHLSRATYFRRLNQGLSWLAERGLRQLRTSTTLCEAG